MILKDFEIEEVGPGKLLRMRCSVLKKDDKGKWREVKYFKEWSLDSHQKKFYPRAYMEFIQFCYNELKRIDELHIIIDKEDGLIGWSGDPVYDKKFKWQ